MTLGRKRGLSSSLTPLRAVPTLGGVLTQPVIHCGEKREPKGDWCLRQLRGFPYCGASPSRFGESGSVSRFPGATWIPSPNFGYPRNTHGQLAFNINRAGKSGEFWHSQQGRQDVTIAMFKNPATEVSAHFVIPKVGKPVQVVDSSDSAWHTGNYLANLHFHGFEFEGGPPGNLSEPLTDSQIAWGVKVTHWLRDVHGTPLIYVRRDTLWEHNEVKNTACPSGRIPWAQVIASLEDDEMELLNAKPSGRVYAMGVGKRHIGPTELAAYRRMGYTLREVADADIAKIPDQPLVSSGGGGGYTDADAVKAVKDKL